MSKEKVIVGISGGVDSAVAALLLKQQGHHVEGLFMKNWEEDDTDVYCSAQEDLEDAQGVADKLDIPLHTVNFSSEYWDRVFEHFLSEYRSGRTPNPDVLCNREIKFRAFLDYALTNLGGSRIATGHYARMVKDAKGVHLCRAKDENKDQTYFLYLLDQVQLSHALFPLGSKTKQQVRETAKRHGLQVHEKKDSTGICFIGERRFKTFLSQFLPAQPGPMENPEGRRIGTHQGLMYYTLGQRKGLGVGGRHGAEETPWFVVGKKLADNTLLVAQGHDHPLLLSRRLEASQLHWISGNSPPIPYSCLARVRHRQQLQECVITSLRGDRCQIVFHQQQRALTPGQSIVFYLQDECLGGGIMERAS